MEGSKQTWGTPNGTKGYSLELLLSLWKCQKVKKYIRKANM